MREGRERGLGQQRHPKLQRDSAFLQSPREDLNVLPSLAHSGGTGPPRREGSALSFLPYSRDSQEPEWPEVNC